MPVSCPVEPFMPQPPLFEASDDPPERAGWKLLRVVQSTASEWNPEPVNEKTVPMFPTVGVITIVAVTLKEAEAGISFCGVPLTVTFQVTS